MDLLEHLVCQGQQEHQVSLVYQVIMAVGVEKEKEESLVFQDPKGHLERKESLVRMAHLAEMDEMVFLVHQDHQDHQVKLFR